ncbi:phosphoribosyltransferase [Thermobifida halotolerans]|uniref:Phosphoribosyltransferase n=1 Tax=Thermobifida halotolerans TaxID=483545 RepID=A0A399G443_9ACTN|nr:phosphoribosyltransferase family protein [Thermobifida halotolerans]UOE21665.1 phosphoribosyltransferase [Thermobifida halotolerans]
MSPLPVSLPFPDRTVAGHRLAERLRTVAGTAPVVIALPRGGVVVGAELARRLHAPLDVAVVARIGLPEYPGVELGAVTEDGHVCYDDAALARLRLSRNRLSDVVAEARSGTERRRRAYRGSRTMPRLAGRDVVVVDDGAATGGTARAALRMVRRQRPARVVLGLPVASDTAMENLRAEADHIVALAVPDHFHSLERWYRDFGELDDGQVSALLAEHRDLGEAGDSRHRARVPVGGAELDGDLVVPSVVRGTVVLASGHGRLTPHNQAIGTVLRAAGYATLLLDLLTPVETGAERAEAAPGVLGERLAAGVRWLRRTPTVADAPVGLLGTGKAAPGVLDAAARLPDDVSAVVTHGGRVDLAEDALSRVRAPTLVLVQGADSFVRELAEWTVGRLSVPTDLEVVAGAEQLLHQPEEWRRVGVRAAEWFDRHL